jgi:membrane protein DedA with SNARE-associated domain
VVVITEEFCCPHIKSLPDNYPWIIGDNQRVNHIAAFIYAYGYLGIFSLLMLGIVGLPVPDEWLLTFAGYLIFKGHFQIVPTLAAAVLGSICGISVS